MMNYPPIPLLDHAQAIADERDMPHLTEDLRWSLRAVKTDLTSQRGFRWPFPGNWTDLAANVDTTNTGGCPTRLGDGLCIARTWHGMSLGGHGAHTLLIVGWHPTDELGGDADKLRVRRAYVRDVIDGWQLISKHGGGAYLVRADLDEVQAHRP